MLLDRRVITSTAVVATSFVLTAAYLFKKWRRQDINEVMIFCKLQYNAFEYFDKLFSYVEAAKQCINVCMPSIHNPAIQGRLVDLLKCKNIKIRIIIDRAGYSERTHFFIKELMAAGAEIRIKNNFFSSEHKFCLIDDKVLMTGTLDWGRDRSADRWNYAYITSKPHLVQPVTGNFYNIWHNHSCELELDQELTNGLASNDKTSTDNSDIELD